ncbi:hypothetical protein FGF1_40660 [Flavobacteriaceae bacterium GF1]
MAIKKVFYDDNGNEMLFHVNTQNKLYLEITNSDTPDHPSYITLETEDIEEMILMLTEELNIIGKSKSK